MTVALDHLPAEVAFKMCQWFDIRSMVSLSGVNRSFHIVVMRQPIWRELTKTHFRQLYDAMYQGLPRSIPFFYIYAMEMRLDIVRGNSEDRVKFRKECKDLLIAHVGIVALSTLAIPAVAGALVRGANAFGRGAVSAGSAIKDFVEGFELVEEGEGIDYDLEWWHHYSYD